LLNVYLMTPTGLAEMALDRGDVPAPFGAWFEQILDSCRQAADLISALQDLAATELGETVVESLADAVRDVLGERPGQASPVYELVTDLEDADALVRVNPRMLRVVLRHLLSNAEHALVNSTERRITVRVKAGDDRICCECEDTGEGLEAFDPTAVVAPFYSTKGPFARDAAHAALPGTGLGLTVCRHLLALHGGRLQLESRPGRGTAAIAVLPRAVPASSAPQEKPAEAHTVRVDAGDEARRPHAASRTSISAEPRK
jgi:two-component system cell cycle sensor histidine kinase PleC